MGVIAAVGVGETEGLMDGETVGLAGVEGTTTGVPEVVTPKVVSGLGVVAGGAVGELEGVTVGVVVGAGRFATSGIS